MTWIMSLSSCQVPALSHTLTYENCLQFTLTLECFTPLTRNVLRFLLFTNKTQPVLFCLPNVLDKTDRGSSKSVWCCLSAGDQAHPSFHTFPCSPWARGLEWRLFFFSACLQNSPQAVPSFLFSAPAPRQHLKL